MRIALCFAGQPRSFKMGYDYYKKNLFSIEKNVDVFIHSWDSKHNNEILDLYKPIRYKFESPLEGEFNTKYTNTPNPQMFPPRNTISSFYSLLQSCLLKIEHEVKTQSYDFVIRTRFDYALNRVIPFTDFEENKLYIPNCRMTPKRNFGNDQFAVGSSYVMNAYMSTYYFMDYFYKRGVMMIGEDMMAATIQTFGLVGDNLVYLDMNNPFPPGPHNGTWHSLIRTDYDQWTK